LEYVDIFPVAVLCGAAFHKNYILTAMPLRQQSLTTEATARPHTLHSQPMLSAYADRKQAGIILISYIPQVYFENKSFS